MFTIKDYVLPKTLEEAYHLLKSKRNNVILGGCAFLRMGSKKIQTAIDLSELNLDFIREEDETIEIGAMTTFRSIETSSFLRNSFNGILSKAVEDIVGVQLRNIVTVGGTVYSRYGFSDFITALLSLDTYVVLYDKGKITLEEFLEKGAENDILIKIVIQKTSRKAVFQSMRNSKSDYAILNTAVSKKDNEWKIVVGARPQRAKIAVEASRYLMKSQLNKANIQHAAKLAADELAFGSNMRGSSEYRQLICKALITRAITEVLS
ncbi:FAD binding domain-containing protein [Clostridiaceae bacterium 35-E11]